MHETLYIAKCLQLIEGKVNRGSSVQWTFDDFKKLQKLIFEASSINLSTHTLERLYGKLKTHKNYRPQADTKNALAIFLGYEDWEHFRAQNLLDQEEISLSSAQSAAPKEAVSTWKRRWPVKIALAVCTGLAAVALSLLFYKKTVPKGIIFSATNPFGQRPHTVKFVHDLSHLDGDDFSIFFPPSDTLHLDKSDSISYKAYLYPGRYMAYLLQHKKPVAQTAIYIQTKGWTGKYYSIYEDEGKKWPLPDSLLMSDGRLYTNDRYIPDSLTSRSRYHIAYTNIRNFNVQGDNAAFEARFKSDPAHGSKVCYDMWFKLMGTDGILKMHFLESGCFGFLQMIFGDKVLTGNKYDLSPFSINMQRWNKARIDVVNKQIQISLNDTVIYKTSYSKSVGQIVGIEITSKTNGETDYVKLYNANRALVYEDDFGGKANE